MFFLKKKKAFTLIEITIVISLLALILTIAVPYGLRFFRVERLNSASREILEALRLSQAQAIGQKHDDQFGVYIGPEDYTLFRGSSYLERTQSYDQSYPLSSQIELSGLNEIVFGKLTGLPSQTGEIILRSGARENVIRINDQGLTSLELNVTIGTP